MNDTSFPLRAICLLICAVYCNGLTPASLFKAGVDAPPDLSSSMARDLKLSTTSIGFPAKPGLITKAKPRHYAWGGIREPPVQSKPLPNTDAVDPWIDFEAFCESKNVGALAKKYTGKYSEEEVLQGLEAIFVSLSGGSKWLTRTKAEESLAVIGSQGFEAALKRGRIDFALGWTSFLVVTLGFASCIVVPTNPAAKALEGLVEAARVAAGIEYIG